MSLYLKLLAELRDLDARIESARSREIPSVIEGIREQLKLYRLSWLDLVPPTVPPVVRSRPTRRRRGPNDPNLTAYARVAVATNVIPRSEGERILDGAHPFSNAGLIGARPPFPVPKGKRVAKTSASREAGSAPKMAGTAVSENGKVSTPPRGARKKPVTKAQPKAIAPRKRK